MAIPADLYRVWSEQRVYAPNQIDVLYEWAMVWYCTTGDGGLDPLDVAIAFVGHVNAGITQNILSQANAVYAYGGRRVAAGGPDAEVITGNLSVAGATSLLPPQCAVLVLGLSTAVRHQTRKWVGGGSQNWIDGPTGKVKTGDGGFNNWMRGVLQPKQNGGITAVPVVWDAAAEVARSIENIRIMEGFRTQRRRSLGEEGQFA